MSEIKMLPLPETLVRSGFKSSAEAYARAVAEHNVKLVTAELHRQFGCELRDPNGTIWDHAAKLQAENERLAEALRGMLDEYAALHAKYDLGDCQATVDARAALRDHDKEGK